MLAVDAAHSDAIKRCPEWCVEKHTAQDPVTSGNHHGSGETFEVWDYSIGDGTAHASITQLMTNHEPRVYVSVEVEVEVIPSELLVIANDLENLARLIRKYSTERAE